METTLQLSLGLATKEQLKKVWAFAVDSRGVTTRRHRSMADLRHYVISSCSSEARRLGVRAGMHYDEVKALFPDIRVLLIGAQNR